MKINQWLDDESGRTAKLAAFFDVSPSAVSQGRSNGVPPERMKAVRDFTNGVVTLDEMLPDPPRKGNPKRGKNKMFINPACVKAQV